MGQHQSADAYHTQKGTFIPHKPTASGFGYTHQVDDGRRYIHTHPDSVHQSPIPGTPHQQQYHWQDVPDMNGGHETTEGQYIATSVAEPETPPIGGHVFADASGTTMQTVTDFNDQVVSLLYTRPLVIHTQILPPGVRADDPRLQNAHVLSERTYTSNNPIFPGDCFTAVFHNSLIPQEEPPTRLVVPK